MWALLVAAGAIAIAGEYSNVRQTEEHAYGYTAQLWRENASLFGLFRVSEGLAGDTPTGIIEDVKFDPRTGKLGFRSDVTTGIVMLSGGRQRPARERFEFMGTLKGDVLAGAVKRFDLADAAVPPKVTQVRLRRQPGSAMAEFATYTEWKREADRIVKRR